MKLGKQPQGLKLHAPSFKKSKHGVREAASTSSRAPAVMDASSQRKKKKKRKAPPAHEPEEVEEADGLDEIFGGLSSAKRAARERADAAAVAAAAAEKAAAAARSEARSAARQMVRDPIFGEEYDAARRVDPMAARVHRFDNASGLNVYKAHDLGLGHGGNTPLCPFDCQCCF